MRLYNVACMNFRILGSQKYFLILFTAYVSVGNTFRFNCNGCFSAFCCIIVSYRSDNNAFPADNFFRRNISCSNSGTAQNKSYYRKHDECSYSI